MHIFHYHIFQHLNCFKHILEVTTIEQILNFSFNLQMPLVNLQRCDFFFLLWWANSVMPEINESCFGARAHTSNVTDVFIIQMYTKPYTSCFWKCYFYSFQGRYSNVRREEKNDMFVNREMHSTVKMNMSQSLLVLLIINCYSETTFCEHMPSGKFQMLHASSL